MPTPGVDPKTESFVKSLLGQKLPHVMYEAIMHKFGKFDFSLGELFVGLRFIIDMFEYSGILTGESVQAKVATQKSKPSADKDSSSNASHKLSCPLCKGTHKVQECPKYKTRDAITERATRLHLCFNCLSTKHRVNQCNSKYSCRSCHS